MQYFNCTLLLKYLSKRYLLQPDTENLDCPYRTCFYTNDYYSQSNYYTIILHNFDYTILVFIFSQSSDKHIILFRVLRSIVSDLKLILSNRYLYIAQLKLLQVYKMLDSYSSNSIYSLSLPSRSV